jgi:hypothetical protein
VPFNQICRSNCPLDLSSAQFNLTNGYKTGNYEGMQDSPAGSGSSDSRTADGVEHLQRAAREMIKAARSFLDLVEEVVEDPDRITEAASSVTEMVKGSFTKQEQPWERSAWPESDADSDTEADADAATDAATEVPDSAEPAPKKTPPSSRVRRITVD